MLHTGDITQICEAVRIRHSPTDYQKRQSKPDLLRSRRARHRHRRRSLLPRAIRQEHSGQRMVQLQRTKGYTSSDSTTYLTRIDVNGTPGRRAAKLAPRRSRIRSPPSTPIVIFAHIPLWMVYPDWGWGTAGRCSRLSSYLKRFGSVTVLNGHIHQVVQKVEGNVSFHTATSTAFPQPAPGKAPNPGPMVVPAGKLKSVLGVTEVRYLARHSHLPIIDSSLEGVA